MQLNDLPPGHSQHSVEGGSVNICVLGSSPESLECLYLLPVFVPGSDSTLLHGLLWTRGKGLDINVNHL